MSNAYTLYGGMLRSPDEVVIDDSNYHLFVDDQFVDGERKARGLIPRDYTLNPRGCYASALAVDMKVIPRTEWPERIKTKLAKQSQLSDICRRGNNGQPIPARDQNGKGYCWAHSSTSATIALRAAMNEPYADLSAYAIACVIKNYRDEGGWGAQSLDFVMARGIPTAEFWPQRSMSRGNDNAKTWENAAKHKVTEGWIDMASAQYDRNLNFDQVATCLLLNIPVVVDYNWWSHSVCGLDLLDLDPSAALDSVKRWGIRIWNSWGDSWSDKGMGVLAGSKAVPDGSVAPRVTSPSGD